MQFPASIFVDSILRLTRGKRLPVAMRRFRRASHASQAVALMLASSDKIRAQSGKVIAAYGRIWSRLSQAEMQGSVASA
jgi:hypothetical protein